jgi:hypothetical protein
MTENREIFYETNLNTIFTDDNCYYLHHRKGFVGKFDKDARILAAVIDCIEKNGNFQWLGKSSGFGIVDKNGCYKFSLHQFLYSVYHNMPIEEIKGRHILFINGDALDFRSENLQLNVAGELCHVDDFIVLTDKDRNYAITNFEDELLTLLRSKQWYYFKKNRCFIDGVGTNFHQVCFCYFNRGATIENFDEVINSFRAECKSVSENRREWLAIDHKDSDRRNNSSENLWLLPMYLNSKKSNHTANLQKNHWFSPTEDGYIVGRIDCKQNRVADVIHSVTGFRPFDVQVFESDEGTDESVDAITNLAKHDEMPDDSIVLKISWLFYGLAALFVFAVAVSANADDTDEEGDDE